MSIYKIGLLRKSNIHIQRNQNRGETFQRKTKTSDIEYMGRINDVMNRRSTEGAAWMRACMVSLCQQLEHRSKVNPC